MVARVAFAFAWEVDELFAAWMDFSLEAIDDATGAGAAGLCHVVG